jgi:hypothetical protein
MAMLLALNEHNGPNVLMPSFENIVNDGDKEDAAEHGGRPVPTSRSQYHMPAAELRYSHRLCSDRIVQRPSIKEQHRSHRAKRKDIDYQACGRAKGPAPLGQRLSETTTPDQAADCDVV